MSGERLHDLLVQAISTPPDPDAKPLTAANWHEARRRLDDDARCPQLFGLFDYGGAHRCNRERGHGGECAVSLPPTGAGDA